MADQDDEIIDQNDIDKLLEASSVDIGEDLEDDASELSQDDIDALMNGPVIDEPSNEEDEDEEDYELDMISQDDINQLVQKKNEATADAPERPETIAQDELSVQEEPLTQEEPAPAIQEEPVPVAQEEPAAQEVPPAQEESEFVEEPAVLEDGVIDESEATGVEECLITQENIDQLLLEDQENSAPEDNLELEEQVVEQQIEPAAREQEPLEEEQSFEEPIVKEESLPQSEQLPQEEPVQNEDIVSEQEVAMEEEKKEDSVEEKSESDAMVVDLSEDDDLKGELDNIENDELQGEIDDLLDDSEGDDEDDWEQDSLISQDDIEDLIKSSENEDEDALGDLDSSSDDNFSDDDPMEEEIEEDEEDSQVILEESEDQPENDKNKEKLKKKKKKKEKKKKKKGSIKIGKKFIVIAASMLLLIGIFLTAGFFFLKGDKNRAFKQRIVAKAIPVEEPVVESVEINVDQKSSESVVSIPSDLMNEPLIMKDFVILAPEAIEGLAYIEADITIDYSTNNAYNEIKQNMPFYRDVIYQAIQKALGSAKGDKITESDLLVIIKKALINALPDGSIKKVGFDSFKAG